MPEKLLKIAVAGDSAGKELAELIAVYLQDQYLVDELSIAPNNNDELYPFLADRIALQVRRDNYDGKYDRAILICGTGIGVCIAANKVIGIRAALCHDTYSAQRAALSNHAHIITMGARVIGVELAKSIVDAFLKQKFDPQSHSAKNINAINRVAEKYHQNIVF